MRLERIDSLTSRGKFRQCDRMQAQVRTGIDDVAAGLKLPREQFHDVSLPHGNRVAHVLRDCSVFGQHSERTVIGMDETDNVAVAGDLCRLGRNQSPHKGRESRHVEIPLFV